MCPSVRSHPRTPVRAGAGSAAAVAALLALALAPLAADAMPWMLKHGYGGCASCHVAPSGAGQLTAYGRAQAHTLVGFKTKAAAPDGDVPRSANFLWFAELPEAVNLSGNLRAGALLRPSTAGATVAPLLMASELAGTLSSGPVVGHATAGFGLRNPAAPSIVAPACAPARRSDGECGPSFVSREHWVGVKLLDDSLFVRAGRTLVPFGLRNAEHNSFVRALTRTDLNAGQSLGLSLSYTGEGLRAELMGLAGNFLVAPDAYRERGYALAVELPLAPSVALGFSSLVARAQADLATRVPTTRHAHGLFARWAASPRVVVLAEADALLWQTPGAARLGGAALAQLDLEPLQGLHLVATAEGAHTGAGERGPALGGWASVLWYALPHTEVRLDAVLRRRASSAGSATADFTTLLQLHTFL